MSLWPGPVRPMLAVAAGGPFDSEDHWFEVKWDGIRCLAFIDKDGLRLQSRNLKDITARYPAMSGLGRQFRGRSRAILDGELIGFENGRPSFHAAVRTGGATVFVAFDIIHLDGEDLVTTPLEDRRKALVTAFRCEDELVCVPPVKATGKSFYAAAVARGMEGVVAKRVGSRYRPGIRSRDWLKIAHRRNLDCIVCGMTAGSVPVVAWGKGFAFGSFVLGCPREDHSGLVYAGNVGTGWDARGLQELVAMLKPSGRTPFGRGQGPPRRIARATVWVVPETVVEVAYREVTPDGVLRHPSLLRVRSDLGPEDCAPLPPPGGRATDGGVHDGGRA